MEVEFNGKKVYFNGEINDTFDTHGPYCMEVEAIGEDDDGVDDGVQTGKVPFQIRKKTIV